jgi:hypothetical protein
MMKIYKTRWFNRWARNEDIEDSTLCNAVDEIASGLYEADLGGGLIKKRIARPGKGKSGGFRTLVATNQGDLWIFIHGFAKNERSNITKDEEKQLKESARDLLSLPPEGIEILKSDNELFEVNCEQKTEIENC